MTDLIYLLKIFAALLLVLMNAIFVAAEFAFVKVRPTRLDELARQGNKLAVMAMACVKNLDTYLSVSQLGITLSSIGLGWLGEPVLARLVEGPLTGLGFSTTVVHTVAFAIAFGVITLVHVILGELVPKSLAIQNAEKISLMLAVPMRMFYRLFLPAIIVMNGMANLLVKMMGSRPAGDMELAHTEEELRMLVSESYKSGHLKESEQELLQNVFDFEKRIAREIIVPRSDVIFLSTETEIEENVKIALASGHTRFPLIAGDTDHVIGMIHIKDLFSLARSGNDMKEISRDIMYVPEGQHIDRLLRDFQRQRQHMAVVVDEYGGTAGIVTMENVLEELVGEIQDEFDDEAQEIKKLEDGSYSIAGMVLLDEFVEKFRLDLGEGYKHYDTMGGYVFGKLGKTPKTGDRVQIPDAVLEVEEVDGLRVTKIRLLQGAQVGRD